MSQTLSAEFDIIRLTASFSSELAFAETVADGEARCLAFLQEHFAPKLSRIVWQGDAAPPASAPTPPSDQLEHLRNGGLAPIYDGERVRAVFAPLRARARLQGWLYLEEPVWNADGEGLLAAVAGQAGPVLAMLEASTRRAYRVTQLQSLNDVGRVLSGVLDLDNLLEAIYNATQSLVDAPGFYIALYNAANDEFELAYIVEDGVRRKTHVRWSSNVGLTGVIARERREIVTDDYPAECRRRGIERQEVAGTRRSHAWLGVPLLAHDHLIGIMNVSSFREGYSYSSDSVEVLKTLAAQAAVAIENARLYQRSERQARQLVTLNRISRTITSSLDPEHVPPLIIEHVTNLLEVEESSLLLLDESNGDLVFAYTNGPTGHELLGKRLARGTGIAGYVAAHGESVIVEDVQKDERFDNRTDQTTGFTTRSMLAVPLAGVGGVYGVIEAINRRDGSRFTADDQKMLEALADQAVIALENARRFAQVDEALARRAQELVVTNDRLQNNLRSLTALNALGMAINTSLRRADEIFGMTARGVVEMTGALGASVVLDESGPLRMAVQIGPTLDRIDGLASLVQQVVSSGRTEMMLQPPPVLVRTGARAVLAVPLRATQRTLGALCVYYGESLPDASAQETVLLFSAQASVAAESLDLFTAVRSARDQMASILASTREGIMLITPDGQVAITNVSLDQLCGFPSSLLQGSTIEQFLGAWEENATYMAENWLEFSRGLRAVVAGRVSLATGELLPVSTSARALEWAALTALSSGGSRGGALLVLRDITEAKESERLRQDLTNMIVHDLRSPLSSVMASIELMIRGIAGDIADTQRNVLNIAYKSAVQMLEMINALLDISRLESGRMPLDQKQHDVRELAERSVERLASLAQERNMLIQYDVADDLPRVFVDGELIVRVLQNLVANALKFSGQGSTVLVRASRSLDSKRPNLVTVAVADRGVGIAPQDREKIFAKFGQVGEQRGGTGLGLTFCKLVAEAHGGEIWVESDVGVGSTFFFTLPFV